jgi:LuxR family transcriptional regulator, maltose regulon positive regulatory protein
MEGEAKSGRGPESEASAVPRSAPPPRLHFQDSPHVSGLVVRRALVQRLSAATATLIVVSGPAGSGKTTLLLQWTERDRRPTGWLHVEAAHNDPVVLVTSLADALTDVSRVNPRVFQWSRLVAPPIRERMLPSLAASIAEALPFVLVLDDAQLLVNKAAWEIVDALLRAFPPGSQLALASRTEPKLAMGRLEAAGQVLEIGGRELAFSTEETAEFLGLRGHDVELSEAQALQSATEGWAAGISLATLARNTDSLSDWAGSVRGGQRSIARYLTKEVLERQPRSVRSFLLETSILDRLSGASCGFVTGRTDAGRILARLALDNLFVAALDDSGEQYRYHHLFAELLQAELRRQDGGKLTELHRRAADWAEEQGDLEAAIRHCLAADEVARAGDILWRGYVLSTRQGQFETVRRWLELFTDEQIHSSIPLTLAAGWVSSMTGDGRTTRLWSSAGLDDKVDDSPMPDGMGSQRMSQASLRASLAPDGVTQMRRDAELAADLAAGSPPVWRSGLDTIVGVARWLFGDFAGAQAAFDRAIRDAFPYNIVAETGALGNLSLLLCQQGRWEEAEACSGQAAERFRESELGLIGPTLAVPLSQALVGAHKGDPGVDQTLELIRSALGQLQLPMWERLMVSVILAEVALERNDLGEATRCMKAGEATLRTWPDAGILRTRLEHLHRILNERRLADPLTPMEERVLQLLPIHLTLAEIAGRLSISENTVKTHLRGLFRKLGVHSRSEAVEKARPLGLLKD